ncbi:acyl-CoA dehydrogenase family protein [Herpetosiphon llansteffanensis]|uniref:acyl-CoA dehydrogenase family protein n=1 Tax=Herpetosiphon llansteffanensis TaxID=2094568 RepID=UPI000D7BCFC1
MYFNADHQMFRQTIRRFVEREINPFVEQWEHERCFPGHALFKKLGELGALGVSYPEAYGGAGLDYWYNVVLAEEVGRADCGGVPMAILVHTDMATPALAEFGSDDLRQRFLAPAIRGELIAAVAISEPDAGSDVASIRTRAVRDGDEYVINGSKMWITNGTQADFITLLARTSDEAGFKGMSLIIVPTNTPGFHVSKKLEKLGNHSSDTALLAFDDLRVPVANRIGEEGQGFGLQMQQFQKERLIGAVSAVAGMEKIVALTINYCRERQTFGKALIDNQYIHFRLAELLTEIEALRQLNYHCTRLLIAGHDITKEVSMAKLKAGRLVREVADSCLQFHGGMGYVEEYPLARYFRDSRLLSIGGGADEIMLGIIAKYAGMVGKRR